MRADDVPPPSRSKAARTIRERRSGEEDIPSPTRRGKGPSAARTERVDTCTAADPVWVPRKESGRHVQSPWEFLSNSEKLFLNSERPFSNSGNPKAQGHFKRTNFEFGGNYKSHVRELPVSLVESSPKDKKRLSFLEEKLRSGSAPWCTTLPWGPLFRSEKLEKTLVFGPARMAFGWLDLGAIALFWIGFLWRRQNAHVQTKKKAHNKRAGPVPTFQRVSNRLVNFLRVFAPVQPRFSHLHVHMHKNAKQDLHGRREGGSALLKRREDLRCRTSLGWTRTVLFCGARPGTEKARVRNPKIRERPVSWTF